MKKHRLLFSGLMFAVMLSGCSAAGNDSTVEGTGSHENASVTEDGGAGESLSDEETEGKEEADEAGQQKETPGESAEEGMENHIGYIGIDAHIKEMGRDTILISSDTDDYPGTFIVLGAEELPGYEELAGGDSIQILMRNLWEEDEQGLPKFQAESISPTGKEEIQHLDVLLTGAPVMKLTDLLSGQTNGFEVYPGNYSWNYEEDGQMTGVVACGVAPLEEAAENASDRLKLPAHDMDGVPYLVSTTVAPDVLTVSVWDASAMGETDGLWEKEITYYFKPVLLELEAGKIYQIYAEWKEDNLDVNGFYGTASYVFVTE